MFEKSLVDLIRGLRGHKGNEAEYIQGALKECRSEIRSQDLDLKATALLKLIYLEMFGYDMTWAAFNVLEVMASPKPIQKRVGYLAAIQTFQTRDGGPDVGRESVEERSHFAIDTSSKSADNHPSAYCDFIAGTFHSHRASTTLVALTTSRAQEDYRHSVQTGPGVS